MTRSAGLEWVFDREGVGRRAWLQRVGEGKGPRRLRADELGRLTARAAAAGLELSGVRHLSLSRPRGSAAFFGPDGRLQRVEAAASSRFRAAGRTELDRAVRELDALAPVSEVWRWPAGPRPAAAVFRLARPTPWPHLVACTFLGPLSRSNAWLGERPALLVVGLGLVEGRFELHARLPARPAESR